MSLTPHVQPMQLMTGYEWHEVDEFSEKYDVGRSLVRTSGTTWNKDEADTITLTEGNGYRIDKRVTSTESESQEHGIGGSTSLTKAITHTKSTGEKKVAGWQNNNSTDEDDRKDIDGYRIGAGCSGSHSEEESRADGVSDGVQKREDWKFSKGNQQAHAVGYGEGFDTSHAIAQGKRTGRSSGGSASLAEGENESRGVAVHHRKIPLAQYATIMYPTGKLAVSEGDQVAKYKRTLSTLQVGECVAKFPDGTVDTVQFSEFEEDFCEAWERCLEESLTKQIAEQPEYFVPVPEVWTGGRVTAKSERSRKSTRAPRSNGASSGSSAIQRLRLDAQRSSGNGNGKASGT